MKRLLFIISALSICTVAIAHTINWHVDENTYQTTTCDSGESVTPPTAPAKYGYHFVKWRDWRPIEYLESTGTQYIDTGFIPTQFTRTEIDLKFSGSSFTDWRGSAIFGAMGTNVGYQINFGGDDPYAMYSWLCRYRGSAPCDVVKLDVENLVKTRRTLILDAKNKKVSYGGNTRGLNSQLGNYSLTYSMLLFASSSSGESIDFCRSYEYMLVYSFKIYENDILVRDMIPVLDSNNVPCMYDKVTKQFFYNQGTGDFIAGPIVSE